MMTPEARAAAPGSPVLAVDDLSVSFRTEGGPVHAVRGVSLHVDAGETLALVGESGSGKSTVALAALGLLGSTADVHGSAVIAGRQIVGTDDRELRTLRGAAAGMVFQEPASALDPLMRVGRQIVEVIRITTTSVPQRPKPGPSNCSGMSGCPIRRPAPAAIRSSSPAASVSAW